MSLASRVRRAICRDARSKMATCSKPRAVATIRCRRCRSDQVGVNFEAAAQKLGYHPFSTPRAILSQPYNGRPACSYCGFCQGFGCHIGAKSSILVTKLPDADATGNFKLITSAMCYRINSDNSGRVTGVSYYGPDGSADNTIEAEIVIVAPFIYDAVRLMLLSKTEKFSNGLANSVAISANTSCPIYRCGPSPRSTTATSTSTWAERTEAYDRRLQRRQLRPQWLGIHPWRAESRPVLQASRAARLPPR